MRKIAFFALALCAILAVSCKNNKKTENPAATQEVAEAAKIVLADNVMATIDNFANEITNSKYNFLKKFYNLTEEEKLVKPDFLLDANKTKELTTKNQKISALGILIIDSQILKAYNMPTDEYAEAITRLAAEVNHPIAAKDKDTPLNERITNTYNKCKERGELTYFWKLIYAMQNECVYIVSQNPDLYTQSLKEEEFSSFHKRFVSCINALCILAKYDDEIATMLKELYPDTELTDEYANRRFGTLEEAKKVWKETAGVYKERREILLK